MPVIDYIELKIKFDDDEVVYAYVDPPNYTFTPVNDGPYSVGAEYWQLVVSALRAAGLRIPEDLVVTPAADPLAGYVRQLSPSLVQEFNTWLKEKHEWSS